MSLYYYCGTFKTCIWQFVLWICLFDRFCLGKYQYRPTMRVILFAIIQHHQQIGKDSSSTSDWDKFMVSVAVVLIEWWLPLIEDLLCFIESVAFSVTRIHNLFNCFIISSSLLKWTVCSGDSENVFELKSIPIWTLRKPDLRICWAISLLASPKQWI